MKRSRAVFVPETILNALAKLQDGLNCMIDSKWRSVRTLDNWALAITMESTELLDSYPWKWWKNISAKPDFDNIKIELVDILHFSLSGTMQMQSIEPDQRPAVSKKKIEDAIIPFSSKNGTPSGSVSGLIYFPLSDTQNAIASFRNIIQLSNICQFDAITEAIIIAAEDLDFNLVAYYVAKHTLNCIRQMGGYKDGTYVKVNNGVEDNVLLHDCIKNISIESSLNEETYVSVWDSIMTQVYEAFGVEAAARKTVSHWIKLAEH